MKHLFSTLFVVFFATSMMAQTGLTCEDPIPVDSTYRARVEGACELWYTAGTFDLPLNVHFVPDDPNSTWGPEVVVDFTCTYGVYDDPKIDSLINMVGAFDVTFPLELLCDRAGTDEQVEWDLSVNETYRDQLAEFGVTHNVQAYVLVRFSEPGLIRLQPDTTFANCMDSAEPVVLGQEVSISANDSDRVFIMSYTDWQNDSIQFVWTGDAPATIWLATEECDFLPSTASGYVCAHYDVEPGVPYRVHNQDIKDLITANTGGGIFFAKVLSSKGGSLLTEKIPMSAIQGDATLLEYGKPVTVTDANNLFCFPKQWGASLFTATTKKQVTMYVSHSADFTASADDDNVVAIAPFCAEGNKRALYLSSTELDAYKSGLTEDYLYVRFQSEAPITITPDMWSASVCADASTCIVPNQDYLLAARSGNTIFRMRYADFKDYPFDIQWQGSGSLPVYIADTCHYVLSGTNEHVMEYLNVSRGDNITIDAETLASWESRAEDGYFYVRFNPSNRGMVTFLTDKPTEDTTSTPDPIYTTESATVCFGESYEWNGKEYNATGKYTYTTVAANGADSIVTLDLTVLPEVAVTNEKAAVCYGETYTWQGQEYTASGEYSVTLQDVNGCDSVITLTLTVHPQTPATTEEITVKFGETYEWNGVVYNESGEYTITLQDENGCDYQATLILTVLPEEKPVSPCVAASTLLEPVAELTLNLGNAFDIYRIDYEAWLASGVNLVWTGKGALHTFVAKDCEFAVAVYHKDVVNYTEVPAEGNVVLSKAILAPLAQYVDADGYLYVRFLTELEGQLSTTLAE